MTLDHLLAFNAVLVISILSPGAAFLMAVRSSVSNGRRAGIATGFGLGVMASLWVLVVVFPPDLAGSEIAFITLNHLTLEILFYTACAFILTAPVARARFLRAKTVIDRTAALLLGGLGLKLLLQR